MAPICGKITLAKESIKAQNVTNGTNLINQPEAPVPEVIVVEKLRTDISVNSRLIGGTRAIVKPEKSIQKR